MQSVVFVLILISFMHGFFGMFIVKIFMFGKLWLSNARICFSWNVTIRFLISLCCYAAYCVVVIESAGRQIPMAFLERVKEDFNKRYGGGKASTAKANSLNKEFGYF